MAVAARAPPGLQLPELSGPPAGWSRYRDPASGRTYLYCDATAAWHWEDEGFVSMPVVHTVVPGPELIAEDNKFEAAIGQGGQPSTETAVAEVVVHSESPLCDLLRDPELADLAQADAILRDLIRDASKLRKKFREIVALEAAAAAGQQLLDAQVMKVARRGAIEADMTVVKEQIEEARQHASVIDVAPVSAPASGPSSKARTKAAAAKAPATSLEAMNPLPQKGKAPMPIPPQVANSGLAGNTASRLAAYAPISTPPDKAAVSASGAASAAGRSSAKSAPTPAGGACTTQPSQAPSVRVVPSVKVSTPVPAQAKVSTQVLSQATIGTRVAPSAERVAPAAAGEPWRPPVPPPPIPGSQGTARAAQKDEGFTTVKRKAKASARK